MTEDAHIGSHVVAAAGPATNLSKLYRGGRVLLAVGLAAVAFSCFYERWDSHLPKAGPLLFYFHNLLGVALVVCALGIATVRRARAWAAYLGAVVLLVAVFLGVYPYWQVVDTRDELLRVALIGAMLMLAGLERHREGRISRWFRVGRWVFGVAALVSIAAETVVSSQLQSGDDMFYQNYDVNTLFNSIWAWHNYPLASIFGPLTLLGAALLLFRRRERAGAICLATTSILFLPLFFLYRCDDFFGGKTALIELAYSWALDLGVAGGALVVAAAFRKTFSEEDANGSWLAERTGNFLRRMWVRATLSLAGLVLLAAIVFHGLIPFFFYEANSRGYEKLGDWATRVYAATYFPVNGNTYLTEKLLQTEMGAGPAGRACAANDANGCNIFGDFYSLIGWNWGRAWRFHAKAASLSATQCNGGGAVTLGRY
jgi:hypothetical protein